MKVGTNRVGKKYSHVCPSMPESGHGCPAMVLIRQNFLFFVLKALPLTLLENNCADIFIIIHRQEINIRGGGGQNEHEENIGRLAGVFQRCSEFRFPVGIVSVDNSVRLTFHDVFRFLLQLLAILISLIHLNWSNFPITFTGKDPAFRS